MKKLMSIIGCAVAGCYLMALPALGSMRDVDYSIECALATTNTQTYTVRGEIVSVIVTVPAASTGTVALTHAGETIFSKSIGGQYATTNKYNPRVAVHGNTGSALSDTYTFVTPPVYTGDVVNVYGGATNTTTVARYEHPTVAGSLDCTINKTLSITTTNTWKVKVIYNAD